MNKVNRIYSGKYLILYYTSVNLDRHKVYRVILPIFKRKYKKTSYRNRRLCSTNSDLFRLQNWRPRRPLSLISSTIKAWRTSAEWPTWAPFYNLSLTFKGQKLAAETIKEFYADKMQDFKQQQNSWDASTEIRLIEAKDLIRSDRLNI